MFADIASCSVSKNAFCRETEDPIQLRPFDGLQVEVVKQPFDILSWATKMQQHMHNSVTKYIFLVILSIHSIWGAAFAGEPEGKHYIMWYQRGCQLLYCGFITCHLKCHLITLPAITWNWILCIWGAIYNIIAMACTLQRTLLANGNHDVTKFRYPDVAIHLPSYHTDEYITLSL